MSTPHRIWDGISRWVPVESCVSVGSNPVTRSEGYHYHGNALLEAAPGRKGWISGKEGRAVEGSPSWRAQNLGWVQHARQQALRDERRCLSCEQPLTKRDWSMGCVRCQACRAAGKVKV